MTKAKAQIVPMAWWHIVTVEIMDGDRKEEFSFCPTGLGVVEGWVFNSWIESVRCNFGHYHKSKAWFSGVPTGWRKPGVPPLVLKKLKARVKNIRHIKPWPGRD